MIIYLKFLKYVGYIFVFLTQIKIVSAKAFDFFIKAVCAA